MEQRRHTALVTGGTSGVGLSIARALVDMGSFVHVVGRDPAKGQQALALLNATGANARFWPQDLSLVREVETFAARFAQEVDQLDTLVNAAGVVLPTRRETAEGIETTLAIDHLSAFVLARDLAALLAQATKPRIVNVAGPVAQMMDEVLDFDDLQMEQGYSMTASVVNALHAKTVMTQRLAEHYADRGIDVLAVDPGAVRSNVGRNLGFPMSVVLRMMQWFMAEESQAGIYASTSDALDGKTGHFVAKHTATPLRFGPGYTGQLWQATEALVETVPR